MKNNNVAGMALAVVAAAAGMAQAALPAAGAPPGTDYNSPTSWA